MDNDLFNFIIKYLEDKIVLREKSIKDSQIQWLKLVKKYALVNRSLKLKDQDNRRIVSQTQFYPLIYTFHNDLTVGHLGYKKVLQKLTERYY